jgi:carbon storage regulator
MLVLSRKPGERIFIGEDVAVTIVRIGPNTVKLGIEAPRTMNIVREELCAGALPKVAHAAASDADSRPAARVAE